MAASPPLSSKTRAQKDVATSFTSYLRRISRQRPRRRKALPVWCHENGTRFYVSACPDTGSYENVMSLEMAQHLGVSIEQPKVKNKAFCTANGRVITPVGKTIVSFSFAKGTPHNDPGLQSTFHIFKTLPVPLIMGLQFLEETETWTKHRDRLVDEEIPFTQSHRTFSIGRQMRSIACRLDRHAGSATIDTGSDLNFVSESFARARDFYPDEVYHKVMLADGSFARTRGTIRVSFAVGVMSSLTTFIPKSQSIEVEFHVLAGLSSDILIGQDTTEELNIFQKHHEYLRTRTSRAGESELCIIRYIGKVERKLENVLCKLRRPRTEEDDPSPDHERRKEWELEDQRENARREAHADLISSLSGEELARAKADEANRIRQYEIKKRKRVQTPSG